MIAFVEIKTLPPRLDEKLFELIERTGAPNRVALHGFDHRVIRRLGERRPLIRRGALMASYPVDPVRCLQDADATILWQHNSYVDEALVAAVHGAGMTMGCHSRLRIERVDLSRRLKPAATTCESQTSRCSRNLSKGSPRQFAYRTPWTSHAGYEVMGLRHDFTQALKRRVLLRTNIDKVLEEVKRSVAMSQRDRCWS